MHDIADLESRGIPGVYIASAEFIDAAKTQSEALGMEPVSVFVPHPIQDRCDEEIIELADNAFEEVLRAVCAA